MIKQNQDKNLGNQPSNQNRANQQSSNQNRSNQQSKQPNQQKQPQKQSSSTALMDENQHAKFMKRAIELSRRASIIEKSGGVFGAVIVKDGKIIGEGYNQVIRHNDPTWHAEMEAIRNACKKLGTPHLEGCTLYTSAECCPMCLATAYWAHIDKIYCGATTGDALKYGDFADIDILEEVQKDPEDRRITFTELMRPEAVEVWKEFAQLKDRARY